MTFALMGNQNSGKTTLFNRLTGSDQQVSNYPGVTVERMEGRIRNHPECTIVDLPGIYSLSPYSPEEIISRDFLIEEKPDLIMNVVDATSLERGLYLTLQLIELDIPMTLALNMIDEMPALGRQVDVDQLQEELGIPVVAISASQNKGVSEYARISVETAKNEVKPKNPDLCIGTVHRAIHSIAALIEDHAEKLRVTPRFAATKLVESDDLFIPKLGLNQNELDAVQHIVAELERESGTDRWAAIADMRYDFISGIEQKVLVCDYPNYEEVPSFSRTLDRILIHKYLGIPLFFAIMAAVFWITFGPLGSFLSEGLAELIGLAGDAVGRGIASVGMNPLVRSAIVDGIFSGVGSVLEFLPMILLLFFLLSILEDSGYMARVAFMMDRLLRHIGLSGASMVPMLLGFGCSVPAVMATRTLPSKRDRYLTTLLIPFMSCSAKVPVYGLIARTLFPGQVTLVVLGLYILGMVLAILTALLLRRTLFKGDASPFILELPLYRFPSPITLGKLVWRHAKEFFYRAFTIIMLVTMIIWFFQTFDFRFFPVASPEQSMLATVARWISPVFAPLGFNSWAVTSALIAGFTAKEVVISALSVATAATAPTLQIALSQLFTPAAGIAFLVFLLLYTPCAATVTVMSRELNLKRGGFMLIIFYQTAFAWVIAWLAYHLALLVL
ncbi:MAG: ferrous iron transport protein B [Clostridiaceae bacterium]|nr:ferrous iron transport protein B [Clostridiaceae bacterium]